MKTIIAPTDFSDVSLNAVNYASDMASVLGTKLVLIHVCPVPVVFSEVSVPALNIEELMADAEVQMRQLREKVSTRVADRLVIDTVTREGDIVREIGEYCKSVDTYAVIMGAEGANGIERFLFGGKTIAAMQQLEWPLIVVPPGVKFTSIQKIGLACDFRKVVETIPVKEVESLVKEFQAELHVLHVSVENKASVDPVTAEESGWLKDMLEGLQPKYHFIYNADVEKSIMEFAKKHDFDLLIIIPKKHNLVSRIFRHGHSKNMVLHTAVPLMSIHE